MFKVGSLKRMRDLEDRSMLYNSNNERTLWDP